MPIYTKKGDTGKTSLIDGERVPKHTLVFSIIGTLDELNASLGVVISQLRPVPHNDAIREVLIPTQKTLLTIGSILAGSDLSLDPKIVINMEAIIDHYQAELPELTNFVLPGGSPAASSCHLSRTICRRAERLLSALIESGYPIDTEVLKLINRLSDMLFVLARAINRNEGVTEIVWVTDNRSN